MSDTDLAYLAGIIDGEGTISCSISNNGKGINALHLQLSVFNTNIELMKWLQERFGGKVFSRDRNPKWKVEHQLKWSAKDATTLLKKVLPYLVIKSEQAELFIRLRDTKSCKVSEEVHQMRFDLVNRVSELNRRGTN